MVFPLIHQHNPSKTSYVKVAWDILRTCFQSFLQFAEIPLFVEREREREQKGVGVGLGVRAGVVGHYLSTGFRFSLLFFLYLLRFFVDGAAVRWPTHQVVSLLLN